MKHKILYTALAVAALSVSANAQLIYETGFETFNLGPVFGQDGWDQVRSTAGPGDALVTNNRFRSGSQSLMVSPVNGTGTGGNWWWKTVPHDTATSANKIMRVEWDMYLEADSLQGFYGIDVYNVAGSARYCAMRVIDTNAVQIFRFDGGVVQEVLTTATTVARDTWNRYRLDIDFSTGTFKAYVNGVEVGDGNINRIATAGGPVFGDADIYFVNFGGDSNDSANYDNLYWAALKSTQAGDVDGNGCVDDADLLAVLFAFGSDDIIADLDDNGVVDDADLLLVLFNFGNGC
jgi:hypothetical protein